MDERVDFALGIDTDGGVRVPVAFFGILGFCPSHGVVSTVGVVPMTQSFDTVDWFSRDPNIHRHVGHVLLQLPLLDFRQRRCILIAHDCFQFLRIPEKNTLGVVISSVENIQGQVLNHINLGQYIASKVPSLKVFKNEESRNGEGNSTLKNLCDVFLLLQRYNVLLDFICSSD